MCHGVLVTHMTSTGLLGSDILASLSASLGAPVSYNKLKNHGKERADGSSLILCATAA